MTKRDGYYAKIDTYCAVVGDSIRVELMYPRSEGLPRFIHVGLCDVRAADGLRLSYDFDRDGWKVEQASVFEWEVGSDCDPGWKEVAFVQAWASQVIPDPKEER